MNAVEGIAGLEGNDIVVSHFFEHGADKGLAGRWS